MLDYGTSATESGFPAHSTIHILKTEFSVLVREQKRYPRNTEYKREPLLAHRASILFLLLF